MKSPICPNMKLINSSSNLRPSPPSSDPAEPASSSPEYPPKLHGPIFGAEPSIGEVIQSERTVGSRIKNAFKIFQHKKPAEKINIEAAPKRISEDRSSEDPWEARFEKGAYPFIRSKQNRAACATCLVGYVPPRRREANPVPGAMTSTSFTNKNIQKRPTVMMMKKTTKRSKLGNLESH
ncbi:hypothetical protein FRC03_009981 [Tulasnella sp. 419]|nr:hypothetical protein FRC02_010355 [Tulasnella sp. 418]KAG8957604.1 hypothetical protein FRC03_009981 [Tulasnella sp. 419]